MAKGFKSGGGGGTSLNFKVVGNPQPASPRENTIWLNTDVPIGAWYFDASQPDDLQEGDVWFPVGTSSPVEFNALKKNRIQVYPLKAQQYVGGALVGKTAKIYRGGEWIEWTSLYDTGKEFADFTGGWAKYFVSVPSFTNSGTLTKNDDNLQIQCPSNSSIIVKTANKIDVTHFTVAEFDVECISKYQTYALHCFVTDKEPAGAGSDDMLASARADALENGERGVVSVDISGLSGMYYVGVKAWQYNNTTTLNYKVRKVVLK